MAYKGLMIVLGTVLVASAPATAESNAGNDQTKAAEAHTAKEKKYCVKEANTGTRLASVDCRTKAEWAREGIDIEAVAKGK